MPPEDRTELIEKLLADRDAFNDFVYTPLSQALKTLQSRREDATLKTKVFELLGDTIPDIFKSESDKPKAVLFRQIATPNYESLRFMSIAESIDAVEPMFLEYLDDKFVTKNEFKRLLGRLFFFHGQGKNGGNKVDSVNIIDFNKFNGKKLSEVQTLHDISLTDFHKQLFARHNITVRPESFYDASPWFNQHSGGAKEYYQSYLLFFIRNGILFENFMLENEDEKDFIKNIFLPTFITIQDLLGLKPLIIPLEPTDIEGEKFWFYYPGSLKSDILKEIT